MYSPTLSYSYLFIFNIHVFVCVCVLGMYVEIRGWLWESVLPACGGTGMKSVLQAWQQAPLHYELGVGSLFPTQ